MRKDIHKEFPPMQFKGVCSSCREIYEAKSGSDDLEGITFQCKKSTCGGRVTLAAAADKAAGKNAQPVSPKDLPALTGAGPKRYC